MWGKYGPTVVYSVPIYFKFIVFHLVGSPMLKVTFEFMLDNISPFWPSLIMGVDESELSRIQ